MNLINNKQELEEFLKDVFYPFDWDSGVPISEMNYQYPILIEIRRDRPTGKGYKVISQRDPELFEKERQNVVSDS